MPSQDHYVIIGNGPAGNHAALTLRENDRDARITIISDENIGFYSKPKLVRFLSGSADEKSLLLKDPGDYRDKNIRLRLGQTVEQLDPAGRALFMKHKETVHYTKLVIAAGSKARVLPSMGSYADCLQFVTSFNEVMDIRDKIRNSNDFFIFGGDLVGFKFLKMLAKLGKTSTLLIYPNAFWPFNLSDEMLETILKSLEPTGAEILTGDDIASITPDTGRYRVHTKKGVDREVDMVFSFNGLIPNVDFARGCGLDIDRGILVDEHMHTSMDHIYACGSCAQVYNPSLTTYTTSIGWPNAVTQGEVAALNLLGDTRVIETVGRKYFDLEGVKIKTTWWEDIEED